MKKISLTISYLFLLSLSFGQALEVIMDDYTAVPSESFCLKFKVNNFEEIVSSQYSLQWDPAVMSFDSLTANNLPIPANLFYNTSFISMGQLLVNWFDTFGNGNSVPDGTTIYELCFTAIGSAGSSTTIAFTDLPLQIEVTSEASNGVHIGLDFSGGTVTIVDPLMISNVILSQPDCMNPDVGSIELEVEGGAEPYLFEWIGPSGFTADTEDILGLNAGEYFLTITDASNPALSLMDTFLISAGLDVPIVTIEIPDILTCTDTLVTLDASGSSTNPNYELFWLTSTGNIVLNGNTLNPLVNAVGDYELIISNPDNGCSASATVSVQEDVDVPIAVAGMDGLIDCNNIVSILDGSNSSSDPGFSAFWTSMNGSILTGENTFIATVSSSGTYILTIVDDLNGCTATDEAMVTLDTISPIAIAGVDQIQDCLENVLTIDGTGSSVGATIIYEWFTDNGNISGTTNTLITQVNQAGNYELLVTDTNNGCTSNDEVLIELNADIQNADAGFDENSCDDFFQLTANLPENNFGIWTSFGSSIIEDSTQNITLATMLEEGENNFVWTLSTVDCNAYDSDTIIINLEQFPIANDDTFIIPFGDNPTNLDLILNDEVSSISDFNIDITATPSLGTLTEIPGFQFDYSYPESYFGQLTFEYQLCNVFCSEFCDTATVFLTIEDQIRIDTTIEIPNGITPNDDGINDTFVFPVLEDNPGLYPNNEIVIFNRWGDVVFQNKPYMNDWAGTNRSGKALPQGTYYYVLKLNIAQGEIIKGEVTILR